MTPVAICVTVRPLTPYFTRIRTSSQLKARARSRTSNALWAPGGLSRAVAPRCVGRRRSRRARPHAAGPSSTVCVACPGRGRL